MKTRCNYSNAHARGTIAAGSRNPETMKPIADFLTDFSDAESAESSPAHAAHIDQLARAVDRARTDLADAIAAWSVAVNERAAVRRAGRLLRELGYDIPQPQGATPDPAGEAGANRLQKAKKT